MTRAERLQRLRSRKIIIPLIIVLVLAVTGIVLGVSRSSNSYSTVSKMIAVAPEPSGVAVQLDTTLYLPDSAKSAPAVLLAQGFGGSKSDLAGTAATLAKQGYVALAYTARGFGDSGGLIHFDNPEWEVKDASTLIDYLDAQPQVDQRKIAVAGSSYGGGLALLLAAYDHRVKAVAADITWNNLQQALFPNTAGNSPGVFKRLWTSTLFGEGFSVNGQVGALLGGATKPGGDSAGTISCGRFAPVVCAAYQNAATTGTPDAALLNLMREASPSSVIGKISAPTLLTQGENDSLFPLSQADANARGIAANATPVKVVWRRGGHDDSSVGGDVATSAMLQWFGEVFGEGVATQQPFEFSEQGSTLSSSSGRLRQQLLQATGYPGIGANTQQTKAIVVAGPPQQIGAPAGGTPAAITAIPGLSGLLDSLGSLSSAATSGLSVVPSQTAAFVSPKLSGPTLIAGSPTVRVTITPKTTTDATLFFALRDVSADGSADLPSELVSPARVTGLTPGRATTITVQLPSIVHTVVSGHRLVLTVATTDFAYQMPLDARSYTISLDGLSGVITLPIQSARVVRAGHPLAWLIVGIVVALLTMLIVGFVIRRRRTVLKPRADLAHVPVSIKSLVKEYAGGYRAVDDISFTVERGQVVGLLGPNGAGKTTALRVLVGLILPTAGQVHVFGEPIVPGAPVLSRLGAFIEGPGFLPHLSGRQNLSLFWAATGRPLPEANFDTALEIAGLGASVDRRVKTYSQGMRQRLGIAQAMLGLPELLVLDEPTNGLDPPQIAEMREVMKRYAETGRTVVVSSHLLSEVEQTCSHVVVMHKGKIVAAGSVVDIAGTDGVQVSVEDPARAAAVLESAGIVATLVPARRALEEVFLGLIGGDE